MKTPISPGNPFGRNAKGYLWEYFNRHGKSALHLDYGAHDAHMLVALTGTDKVDRGIGVDLNSEAVAKAQSGLPENVTLMAINKNPKLPFEENYFDSVSIVGVLEHIQDQKHIVNELIRVTRPGGSVFVAVPGKHLFSFLDMGNWKFVFPRAHKFFFTLSHTEEEYRNRFVANKDGLIGDIEAEKAWHEHFSRSELEALLRCHNLTVVETDGIGFFYRIFVNIGFFLPRPLKRITDSLIALDSKLFSSAEIWTMARKPA